MKEKNIRVLMMEHKSLEELALKTIKENKIMKEMEVFTLTDLNVEIDKALRVQTEEIHNWFMIKLVKYDVPLLKVSKDYRDKFLRGK